MIRVLHMVGTMDLGGQETFIMNIFNNIDRTKYQFDFVVQSNNIGYYEETINDMGGKIYRITNFSRNPIKHIIELRRILKNNHYDVFHRHANSSIIFIDLLVAKLSKVKTRIAHCHSTHSNHNNIIHYIFRAFVNKTSNVRLACSKEAGLFMFGNATFNVINNGINIEQFLFNPKIRKKIRNELNIPENSFVIGHVGRFAPEKNHEFIIDLFKKIQDKKINNPILMLIGDGQNIEKIKNQVFSKSLEKKVLFLGNKNNVCDYLQAMDIFVFPSLYEGLGISLIEAQASGLKCIVSDRIPDEAIVTENVAKKGLNSVDDWANLIMKFHDNDYDRKIFSRNDKLYSYDIINTTREICKIYKRGSD